MATALLANPGFQDLGCFHLSLVDDDTVHHAIKNHVVVCCARVVLIPEDPGSKDGDIFLWATSHSISPIRGTFSDSKPLQSSPQPDDPGFLSSRSTLFHLHTPPWWIQQGVYKPLTMSSEFPQSWSHPPTTTQLYPSQFFERRSPIPHSTLN